MKNIHDIFKEFVDTDPKNAKELFIERLRYYIFERYDSIAEFNDAYVAFLLNIEEKTSPDIRKIKGRAKKNIANWLDPLVGIKRETIINIAFVLANNQKKDGEKNSQ